VVYSQTLIVIDKKIHRMALCALVCERLRCEPWRPWGWGETTRGRPARRGVGH